MNRSTFARLALTALLAMIPSMVTAQAATTTATSATPSIVSPAVPTPFGPTLAPAGVSRATVAPTAEPLNLQGTASRRDVSWMIIGGAALVVGSMVDGDAGTIIMVTGAVVGLTGLWRYLQ